jgi:hypothetical protein
LLPSKLFGLLLLLLFKSLADGKLLLLLPPPVKGNPKVPNGDPNRPGVIGLLLLLLFVVEVPRKLLFEEGILMAPRGGGAFGIYKERQEQKIK